MAGGSGRRYPRTRSRIGPCPSFKGYTALAVAVLNGHTACAEHLLKCGDSYGLPLWIAAAQNDTDMVRLLLSAKADVDVDRRDVWPHSPRRLRGCSLIDCVAADDQLPMMEVLLAAKASARRALRYAAEGQPTAVRLLLDHGASADSCDDDDYDPIHIAASCGCTYTIGILIAAKADIDAHDSSGADACWTAVSVGHPDAARLLRDHGAVAHAPYWYQWAEPDWADHC